MTGLPCPNCGSELAFLEQYKRHYCYACGRYAPEGYGDRGAKICPTCKGLLAYVSQYDRYYCYRCNAYPPVDAVLQSMEEPAPVVPPSEAAASEPAVVVGEPAKSAEPTVTAAEVPEESRPEPEEHVEEEMAPEEDATPRVRPPLIRRKIFQEKKTALMDLCKAYDLEPTGTKEELRERLLSYLDTLEAEAEPEETAEETEEQAEPAATEAEETVEDQSWIPATEVEEEEPVVEEATQEEPTSEQAPAARPAVVEMHEEPTREVRSAPGTVAVAVSEPQYAAAAPVTETTRALHPCPTCGRELAYISVYRRWYCYSCRAYAPIEKSRFACPNCGAALRWIGQYERWWCDSCRRYAPADLPKPQLAAVAASSSAVLERSISRATTFVHRHRSPGSGIGLLGFGVVLFVIYEVFVDLPAVLSFSTGIVVTPDVAFGLRFFAFVFVAIGAISGLSAVRDRR